MKIPGYKKLLAYKKSEELMSCCHDCTELIKDSGLYALADQMERSARSVKQNLVEGYKRNTTKEYLTFIGFSTASLAELNEDAADIIKGQYAELRGIKGLMGERGMTLEEVDRLPFYPLPPLLPLIVQLRLRCKELDYLLYKLKQSLDRKMQSEGTLSVDERARRMLQQQKADDEWLKKYIKDHTRGSTAS